MSAATHRDLILDQFTRQAGPEDTVLDVACGGGIVVCAFAPEVRHATITEMFATPGASRWG